VRQAKRTRQRCRKGIEDAERLLTESLGLSHLDLSETLFYERDFSDLQAAHRFGAEYFMPCKQRAIDALKAMPGRALTAHYRSVREMFDPTEARRGDMVRNFDLTDALEPVLDFHAEPMPAIDVGSMKKKFQSGDVVISRLRSYLREIALVRTPSDIPAIGSSEFIVLRAHKAAKGAKPNSLSPETMLIYLRSLPVQTILRWSQDGSQHPRFNEADLLAIPVPDTLMKISKRVDALVNQALNDRKESAGLIEEAKAEVERLVLGTA
jgi:hypothetical protein